MALVLYEENDSTFELLGEEECRALLETRRVGRVAVSIGAIPAVFPVNYAMAGGAVHFLTAEGTKLAAAVRSAVVAFEVDDIDEEAHSGWSVLVVGEAGVVPEADAARLAAGAGPEPWAPGGRRHLVRVSTEFVSGRRIGQGREVAAG
jgi:nitroimidazol reductase NimA-like FMN-containing flavoprotein (pyridoxamine 5'-phosphate oxidase superfamily)